MGDRIFVFTAGQPAAREHLAVSVQKPVALSVALENVPADEHPLLRQLDAEHGLYAWGAVPGELNQPTWVSMQVGDWVLCVYSNAYHYVARVTAKLNSERFARAVWGSDREGETWRFVYFMDKPVEINIPLNALSKYLRAAYRGFARIGDDATARIVADFGSVDRFIDSQVLKSESRPGEALFALIRSNEGSAWNDEHGRLYRFGSSVPNHKKLLAGARVIVDSKAADGPPVVVGYGQLAAAKEAGEYTREVRAGTKYESHFVEWHAIEPPRSLSARGLERVRAEPGYNVQHAIRPLSEDVYRALITELTAPGESHWLFQANPQIFNVRGATSSLKEFTWLVNQYEKSIKQGMTGYLWESGKDGGVVARATTLTAPTMMGPDEGERPFHLDSARFASPQLRVRIRIDRRFNEPISRDSIRSTSALADLPVLRFANATNYLISAAQYRAIRELEPSMSVKLDEICSAFSDGLRVSHVTFGRRHDELVRAFIASLIAKPFAILTGTSGSGKTQIALRFGDWLGSGRALLVPVRPDWTGAEALFGFEDALRPAVSGSYAWHVPRALEFILEAAGNPDYPYLLILDEMNLAHVERYFADALSGMESSTACLPNLVRHSDGSWRVRVDGPRSISFPKNLIVVGTVNIDETTYMFSPKVLDRANTFEFRVVSSDLELTGRKPVAMKAADDALCQKLLRAIEDQDLQHSSAYSMRDQLGVHLRAIHNLLAQHSFEYGHRVFYEAHRFAAAHEQCGDGAINTILDRIVLQKILPRLHGSRRRLESTLIGLAFYCFSLPETLPPSEQIQDFDPASKSVDHAALHRSFDKLQRMLFSLRTNQFASFTE